MSNAWKGFAGTQAVQVPFIQDRHSGSRRGPNNVKKPDAARLSSGRPT